VEASGNLASSVLQLEGDLLKSSEKNKVNENISDECLHEDADQDSLLSLGLGLGIKVPRHLTNKGRIQSAVPYARAKKMETEGPFLL
jgi:hypothetical protein